MSDFKIEAPQTQRDFMRDAVRRLIERNKDALAEEYAQAEASGLVPRKSNDHAMSAKEYGGRLLDDGLRKGWL